MAAAGKTRSLACKAFADEVHKAVLTTPSAVVARHVEDALRVAVPAQVSESFRHESVETKALKPPYLPYSTLQYPSGTLAEPF